jgi:hypothetical protein
MLQLQVSLFTYIIYTDSLYSYSSQFIPGIYAQQPIFSYTGGITSYSSNQMEYQNYLPNYCYCPIVLGRYPQSQQNIMNSVTSSSSSINPYYHPNSMNFSMINKDNLYSTVLSEEGIKQKTDVNVSNKQLKAKRKQV